MSKEIEAAIANFRENCVWKECPEEVDYHFSYSVDSKDRRRAWFSDMFESCTIIGTVPLPLNTVISWSIKIRRTNNGKSRFIYVGVAPTDIDQGKRMNWNKSGWYFDCCSSKLCSGEPHDYFNKIYGPRKGDGEYLKEGDSIGLVMDTTKGELSFVLNGINLGVAFEGIPLDEPLVPCVLLGSEDDSIILDTSEVKADINSSIPVPANITARSMTGDSVTLKWDEVKNAVAYQVEVDGSLVWRTATGTTYTVRKLEAEVEHSFRVRAVREAKEEVKNHSGETRTAIRNKMSEWSAPVTERTHEMPFESVQWVKCPDDLDEERKYTLGAENPKVVKKAGSEKVIIIGNAPIPVEKVTSWSIKVIASKEGNGKDIFIGVAPFDIEQTSDDDFGYDAVCKCGWFIDCYDSTLYSGAPHGYKNREYGPKFEKGKYVHAGDTIGVVMDTEKGNLSFVLNGVKFGNAFSAIPTDSPLVPCVVLGCDGDSVEFAIAEVDEITTHSVQAPSSLAAKAGDSWDSISLTWAAVPGATSYQIEVDGTDFLKVTNETAYTVSGLIPNAEHNFRVRALKGISAGVWGTVKGKTKEAPKIYDCVWRKCPDYVADGRKYSLKALNKKVAKKEGHENSENLCAIIVGNAPFIPNMILPWKVKIVKSAENNCKGILVGVVPADVDQNEYYVQNKCGWFFDCYSSKLYSGPPHNYRAKEYGKRKNDGEYFKTGDTILIVVETGKGSIKFKGESFDLDVAYDGVPLDKPLVPCVILQNGGDSIELTPPSEPKFGLF